MRNRPLSDEKWNALWRARAKAVRGKTTELAKDRKRIDYLNRLYPAIEWVERYYSTELRFWRFCRHKPCLRARACRGDPEPCLKQSLHTVPRREILHARTKLLNATPLHIGAVELKVRKSWPSDFWRRPVSQAAIDAAMDKEIAEAKRRRQADEELDALWNPYGPDGMGPLRRSRRHPL
jgi:hypothetical protein